MGSGRNMAQKWFFHDLKFDAKRIVRSGKTLFFRDPATKSSCAAVSKRGEATDSVLATPWEFATMQELRDPPIPKEACGALQHPQSLIGKNVFSFRKVGDDPTHTRNAPRPHQFPDIDDRTRAGRGLNPPGPHRRIRGRVHHRGVGLRRRGAEKNRAARTATARRRGGPSGAGVGPDHDSHRRAAAGPRSGRPRSRRPGQGPGQAEGSSGGASRPTPRNTVRKGRAHSSPSAT